MITLLVDAALDELYKLPVVSDIARKLCFTAATRAAAAPPPRGATADHPLGQQQQQHVQVRAQGQAPAGL